MSADGSFAHGHSQIRVLLIDPEVLLADALVASINMTDGFFLEMVPDLQCALAQIEGAPYDVVLLDQNVADGDYLQALRSLDDAGCRAVVLFGAGITSLHVDTGLAHGMAGFIPKSTRLKVFVHALRLIAEGEVYLPANYIVSSGSGNGNDSCLKPRELRVLSYLCQGLQNREIAERLQTDESLVKLDMRSICKKLRVSNRTQAVIKAQQRKLC